MAGMREADVGSAITGVVVSMVIGLVVFTKVRAAVRARRRTAAARGTVVRVVSRGWNVVVPCPDVEFFDRDGGRHVFESTFGRSGNPWPVGSQVEVCYDPRDPENAELSSAEAFGMMIPFLVALGAILTIILTLYLINASHSYP
jgi:hypothetical protein